MSELLLQTPLLSAMGTGHSHRFVVRSWCENDHWTYCPHHMMKYWEFNRLDKRYIDMCNSLLWDTMRYRPRNNTEIERCIDVFQFSWKLYYQEHRIDGPCTITFQCDTNWDIFYIS